MDAKTSPASRDSHPLASSSAPRKNRITTESARGNLWPTAAQCWHLFGSPLRPATEDIDFYETETREWCRGRSAPRVLLLGVTPELYGLPWPGGTDFLAVDRAQAMIDHVWPGPKEQARCAEWQTLDLPTASRDMALCDGGLHLLGYPDEQAELVRILARVVTPGGLMLLRLYLPPATRESPRQVLDDLLAGRVSNLNVLKLRLDTALQSDAVAGVMLADVWTIFHEVAPDLCALSRRLGWTLPHTEVINLYRDNRTRYHFVTLEQVTEMFGRDPGGFEVLRVRVPSYELGGQCPLVVLRRT
jgi:SAM-dependent methyltransferase